jgi:hypothetical protein
MITFSIEREKEESIEERLPWFLSQEFEARTSMKAGKTSTSETDGKRSQMIFCKEKKLRSIEGLDK